MFSSRFKLSSPVLPIALCMAVVAGLTVLRAIFATTIELRVDEAYYWTWSREGVVSFLDHPPLIAWFVRLGTALFGDSNFGVRFPGLVAMLVMQVLLADIVWRVVRDWRYVIAAVLMTEAAPHYGLMMAKIAPDTALIPCELAMIWSLVRLAQSGDQRWWIPAGLFGGLALTAKYTAILLAPAILAFVLVPAWRWRQLASPYFWIATALALLVFSPVLYWNAAHEWASFRFQLDRPPQISGWTARFIADFVGQQLALVGVLLLPVAVVGASMLAFRGYRNRDPIAILLSTAVIFPLPFFLGHALSTRVGDSWPLFVWPIAFACAAINLKQWRQQVPQSVWALGAPGFMAVAIASGIATVVAALWYYVAGSANYLGRNDPIGKEATFAAVVAAADSKRKETGGGWFVTSDYRMYSMLRWHLRDTVPVVQLNERSRYIGFRNPALEGPAGLYVAPKDNPRPAVWSGTGAALQPAGQADLAWRGTVFDVYAFQRVTGWHPVFSPPPGDPLYAARPN
ncbi:MAG: glycosyltransferase family 39 protein [Bradyrhizobium sp.]|nr:glycosyltransferase family 39 protein [Bradyrhizobium sp.]